MKTKKWLLVIGLGLIGGFNFALADDGTPIKVCVVPTPQIQPPNPPISNLAKPQNLP